MKYITGQFALNLPCSLETCGDWHTSALDWSKLTLSESENSIFKDYGIEPCTCVPDHDGKYYVANTLRALLDLLESNNLGLAQGIKDDFICNDTYTKEFFSKVILLQSCAHWDGINSLMLREYKCEWLDYLEEQNGQTITR